MWSYMGTNAEWVESWVYLGLNSQMQRSERGKTGKGDENAGMTSRWQLWNLSQGRRKARMKQGQ